MGPDSIIEIFRHAMLVVVFGVLVLVLPGLVVGLLIAILQAATQVNEMTLSFLPKLIVMLLVIISLAPWLVDMLTSYTRELFMDLPRIIA